MPETKPAEPVVVPPDMQELISRACEAIRDRGEAPTIRGIGAEVKSLNPRGRAAKNQILMAGLDAWEAEQKKFGEVDERVLEIFAGESERMARRLYGHIHEIAAAEWEAERRSHDEERRRLVELKLLVKEMEDQRDYARDRVAELEPLIKQLETAQQAIKDAEAAVRLREAEHKAEVAEARSEAFKEAMSIKQADAPDEPKKPARASRKKAQKAAEKPTSTDDDDEPSSTAR
jgi:TolA-binding protein